MLPVRFLDNRDYCSLQRVTHDRTRSIRYTFYPRSHREAEGWLTVLYALKLSFNDQTQPAYHRGQ